MKLFCRLQTFVRNSFFLMSKKTDAVDHGWRLDSVFGCCKNARLAAILFLFLRWGSLGKNICCLEAGLTKEGGKEREKNADQLLSIFLPRKPKQQKKICWHIDLPLSSLIPLQWTKPSMKVILLQVNKMKRIAFNKKELFSLHFFMVRLLWWWWSNG